MKFRVILKRAVIAVILLGVGFVATPFVLSLNPSQKAYADLPSIDLSLLEEGQYKVLNHPAMAEFSSGLGWAVLIYRKQNGQLRVWRLPRRNGAILMPDLTWRRAMYECREFGPTMVNGQIDETLPIQCHDKDVDEWWADRWQWDIEGRNLSGQVDDMEAVVGVEEAGYFVIGKRRPSGS